MERMAVCSSRPSRLSQSQISILHSRSHKGEVGAPQLSCLAEGAMIAVLPLKVDTSSKVDVCNLEPLCVMGSVSKYRASGCKRAVSRFWSESEGKEENKWWNERRVWSHTWGGCDFIPAQSFRRRFARLPLRALSHASHRLGACQDQKGSKSVKSLIINYFF